MKKYIVVIFHKDGSALTAAEVEPPFLLTEFLDWYALIYAFERGHIYGVVLNPIQYPGIDAAREQMGKAKVKA